GGGARKLDQPPLAHRDSVRKSSASRRGSICKADKTGETKISKTSHSPGRRLSGEKHAPETAARATDDETLRNTGIIPDPAVVEQESAIRNHGNRECTCARAKIDLADLHVIRWRNTRDIRDAKDRDICKAVWHPRGRPVNGRA